jgi:hypothetical protein
LISRANGLVLSVLLGVASAAGSYAVITTGHLADAESKPELASSSQIAQRAHKLDDWEASLKKSLKARPPALPPLNHYAAMTFVAVPAAGSLPAPTAAPLRTVQQAEPVTRSVPKPPRRVKNTSKKVAAAKPIPADESERESPVAVTSPAPGAPAPATAPPEAFAANVGAPAQAPAPAPAPAVVPSTQSVEQQCRALLRAAEDKGEQAKREAEKQCEALKQAAEKRG